jgi:transcriptional regulator with XRE-family HTH domain
MRERALLAARLRAAIEATKQKHREVADAAGVERATLAAILGERQEPKAFKVAALARTLGVSLDYLLGLTDAPNATLPVPESPEPVPLKVIRWGKWLESLAPNVRMAVLRLGAVLEDEGKTRQEDTPAQSRRSRTPMRQQIGRKGRTEGKGTG